MFPDLKITLYSQLKTVLMLLKLKHPCAFSYCLVFFEWIHMYIFLLSVHNSLKFNRPIESKLPFCKKCIYFRTYIYCIHSFATSFNRLFRLHVIWYWWIFYLFYFFLVFSTIRIFKESTYDSVGICILIFIVLC